MTLKNPLMRLYFFGETWHLGGWDTLRWISSNRCTSIMKKTILWAKVTLTFLHMLTIRGLHQNVWLGYFTPSRKRIRKIRETSDIWNKYPSSIFFRCLFWKKNTAFEQVGCFFFEVPIPEAAFLEQMMQALIFGEADRWVSSSSCCRRPRDKKGHPGGRSSILSFLNMRFLKPQNPRWVHNCPSKRL